MSRDTEAAQEAGASCSDLFHEMGTGRYWACQDCVERAIWTERERILAEAMFWSRFSSNRSAEDLLTAFAAAMRSGKGPFDEESLKAYLRASSGGQAT